MAMDADAKTRMSESKPDPLVGRTIDGYRIEELLGRGGMGTVYKATQLSLDRLVAIKVLTDDLAQDMQFLARFHREVDALSRLSHPNIVTVLERGDIDGRPFLAMEYIEGSSLRDLMREGKMAATEALRIVSSVLAALEHAHDKGIVHRDIKPENVLLARANVVKVADFGLSRLIDEKDQTRLTRTNLVLGTYEYMAPEQREHSSEADHRADLYATGVILYEMLTGELPIGRFQLPSEKRPTECDVRIDRIVERSLNKDPAGRYQEAGEMANAVSVVLEQPSAPVVAPAPAAASSLRYRPAKLELHIDNLATIDQVLGTVFYVLAVLAIFNRGVRIPFLMTSGGVGFIMLFIMGWYLRETGEKLRKYRLGARTSQAVIAIVAGFTGVLLPFTFYSFWVLFGHRGRTYYEARGRGLSENEAARHTFRVLEDHGVTPPAVSPTGPPTGPPKGPPRPDQIPDQSVLTSKVQSGVSFGFSLGADDPPAGGKRSNRFSVLLLVGLVPMLAAVVAGKMRLDGATWIDDDPVWALFWIGQVLIALGVLHAIVRPRVRGAVIGTVLLTICATAAFAFEREDTRMRQYAGFRDYQIAIIPSFSQLMPDEPRLDVDLTTWIRKLTNEPAPLPIEIYRVRQRLYVKIARRFETEYPTRARQLLVATQTALLRYYPSATRVTTFNRLHGNGGEYLLAKYESEPAPWDDEPASVWIGTLKRPPSSQSRLPAKELLEPTKEQRSWLASISGFRDVGLMTIEVRSGLVHVVLPKSVFYRGQERVWQLVFAVQQMLSMTQKERDFRAQQVNSAELGIPRKQMQSRIASQPPPANR